MANDNTFYLGLTMAGAISAGAYNGGVFDFLMEALEAWETARTDGTANVPQHRVVIPVMSGASAGGITGALGLIALADDAAPKTDTAGKVLATLPRLYEAWVTEPRFVAAKPGAPSLLGDGDLKGNKKPVASLLDSSLLMAIAGKVLLGIQQTRPPRDYLSDNLHLFLTHASLRGVPYRIAFGGGVHAMMAHADRVHYTLRGLGTQKMASPWADNDAMPIPLDVTKLGVVTELKEDGTGEWDLFTAATLGTSAFPIGLAARVIRNIPRAQYETRQWHAGVAKYAPNDPQKLKPLFRIFPNYSIPVDDLSYTTVDGGTLNNEPFEFVRWTLMQDPPLRNARDEKSGGIVDRAVLMVDPFPEPPTFDMKKFQDNSLLAVITKLFPMLKNHARFKTDDLFAADEETIYSRYLIQPVRKSLRKDGEERQTLEPEPFGIACGLLGGFGGFLDEAMRAHDYQLGRLNCYLFLRDHFALPDSYRVVAESYKDVVDKTPFRPADDKPNNPHLQIIPVAYVKKPEPPAWPRVTRDTVEEMVDAAMDRAKLVVARLRQDLEGRGLKFATWLGWQFGKSKVEEMIRIKVIQDLMLRGQYTDPYWKDEIPLPDRIILAAMVNGDESDMTIADILEAATPLLLAVNSVLAAPLPAPSEKETETVLDRYVAKGLLKWRYNENNGRSYRLPL